VLRPRNPEIRGLRWRDGAVGVGVALRRDHRPSGSSALVSRGSDAGTAVYVRSGDDHQQSLRLIWGTTGLPFSIPDGLRGTLLIGDFIYSYYRLTVLAVSVAAVLGCWLLLNKTAFGMIVRAGTRDPEMVRALGISLKPALAAVFALGVGLAGLAGVMSGPLAGVQPAMGTEMSPRRSSS
jgi:hypothetical protein